MTNDRQVNTFTRVTGRTGRLSISMGGHLIGLLGLLGRVLYKSAGLMTGRVRFPARGILAQINQLGIGSLGVTILAASAVGISLIFLSFENMKNLGGASIFAFFFTKALFREIGPVLAGIVMAVRIGSHVSSRIGSVPIGERVLRGEKGEELDLAGLLLPAFLAVWLVGPALYLFGVFFGLMAGVISQTRGSVESFILFFRMVLDSFAPGDIGFGLCKSLAFGVAVVSIASYIGFITAPDPESVQKAMVRSIVVSAVLVLAINAIFALSYTYTPLLYHLQGL